MLMFTARYSFASHLMRWLGRVLIARPATLGVPEDFYAEPGDRQMPTREQAADPDVQRARIRTDAIRRSLSGRVAVLASIASFAVCAALLTLSAAFSGGGKSTAMDPALAQQCAGLAQLGGLRNPIQQQFFEANCRR